jgi:signal transduction histidine kinase
VSLDREDGPLPSYHGLCSDTRELEPVQSERRLTPPVDEADYREILLTLACAVPLQDGVRAATRMCVDTLSSLVRGCAVGACVVDLDGGSRIVHTRSPDGFPNVSPPDPARLFARMKYERVLDLGGDLGGSTLHIASDSEDVNAPGSRLSQIASSVATVLSSALRRARVFQQSRRADQDLLRLQSQIVQAEKLASLGQLVAGVIHELNNPLTSIVAYSDFLRKKALRQAADPEDLERLTRINEAAERILKFSRDLVAYARPAALDPGPVPLQVIIDKALVFCEHEFAENAVSVSREFADRLPPVRGIAGQLTQVFVNLFTNAAHAMSPKGGELTIRVSHEPAGGVVLVQITDQGVGIPSEDLDRIFEPFFTTKSDGRGTGLGLSIVREIVTSHGGCLSARSTPGDGTTFTLVLPVAT